MSGASVRRSVLFSNVRVEDGRFRVTEKGLTLITPEMLGQPVHQLR